MDWGPYVFSGNRLIDARELEGLEPFLISQAYERNQARNTNPVAESFKAFFPKDGLARDLINHYGNGNGQNFNLNRDQLLEVYPTYGPDGNPINLSLSDSEMMSVGRISPGESVEFSDSVQVYSGTSGTLGNFSVTREGEISVNAETGAREFNGTFSFDDTYDFNASDHRPATAELQVTVARNILPGESFEVSGKLPVNQKQGRNLTTTTSSGVTIDPSKYKKPKDTETRQEEFN